MLLYTYRKKEAWRNNDMSFCKKNPRSSVNMSDEVNYEREHDGKEKKSERKIKVRVEGELLK